MSLHFKIPSIVLILLLLRFGDNIWYNEEPRIWTEILPQGWAFFTLNPLYANLYHYQIVNGKLILIELNSSSKNMLFGLRRDNRRKSLAFNYVFKSPVRWKVYDGVFSQEELQNGLNRKEIINFSKSDSFLKSGLYVTLKKETLLFKKNNRKPKKANYYFEVK